MPDAPSTPLPTPTNYQRTAGGHLQWQPPTPEHLQEMLPAYEVLSILGQGGMGAVYKGRQKSLDRIVAIKILPPEAAEDDMQFAERFKNEARTMAKMNHPAIVHVYDFGETTEGQLYIVMEFIDGTDVSKMIQSQGKLPEDYALSITAHVCDALGYAHTQGVVHRDIKPANVLINMEGQVKVADFGLAKATDPSQMGLTKTNMAMGTPDFVSPEALMPGVPLDGRADLYAVGVMLYNMLTGTIPRGAFRMPSATLQTDARFDQIILKSMEMDRENRYQTALDLRRDLDVILTTPVAEVGVQAVPAQQATLPQKPMGKSPGAPARNALRSDAGRPQQKPAPAVAPAKKSSAGMIYGIAAAVVVIAGAAFMFSGAGKKPAPAPKAVTETKPEPKKPDSEPSTPPSSKPTPTPTESKPAPATAAVAKPDNVLTFGGHRYQLVTEMLNWNQAKAKAEAMGGHLAVVTSKEENEWIQKNIIMPKGEDGHIRLGALRSGPNGTAWTWITGEPVDLALWGGQGPDGSGESLTYDSNIKHWDDVFPSNGRAFLVEWDDDGGTAKPAATSSPAQAGKPAAAATTASTEVSPVGTVDLLGLVDVTRDSLLQTWRMESGVLKSPLNAGAKSEAEHETIVLSEKSVPANYDLRYRIKRVEGRYSLKFFYRQGDGGGYVDIDDSASGSVRITGFSPAPNAEQGTERWFKPGVAREVIIQVRENSIAVCIDGREILRAEGRASKEGQKDRHSNPPDLKRPLFIALNHASGQIIVEEAELRPLGTSAGTMPAAAPVEPLMPPELTALDEQFLKLKAERVAAPFDVEVTKLNTGYVGGIARAIADEKKAGRLDGILALEAEKKLIEDKQPMPETDDAAVLLAIKTLRSIYRGAHAKLVTTRDVNLKALTEPLDKRLAQMETDFIKADRIANAKTVRAYRDALAKSSPGMQPVKTAAIPEPAPAVNFTAAVVYKDGYANTLGMKFVAVKDTDVLMCIHETRCKDWAAYAAENPRAGGVFQPRAVDGFTVTERADDHPVTNTNWDRAHQFCEWLSKKEGKYYRLPTDREWSYAAGVGSHEKWRKDSMPSTITHDPDEFPWGKRWPPPKGSGNFSDESREAKAPNKDARYLERYDDGFPTTAPVMSFEPNKLGIFDLSGNVWEWVEDYFNEKKARALRGGGWETPDRGALLSSNRWERSSENGYDYYGFRIVLVPGGRPSEATATPTPPTAPSNTR